MASHTHTRADGMCFIGFYKLIFAHACRCMRGREARVRWLCKANQLDNGLNQLDNGLNTASTLLVVDIGHQVLYVV